jgi:hypothetical protein
MLKSATQVRPTTGGSVPLGVVRMQGVNSTAACDAYVNGPVLPNESGFGGWTAIAREGDESLVEYAGPEPKRWTLPILIDGWSEDRDIYQEWRFVLEIAEGRAEQPPEPIWFWGTVPTLIEAQPWLVEKLQPEGEPLRVPPSGALRRAQFTLGLLNPNFGETVESPLKRAQRNASGQKASRRIKARPGDTLVSIAARELGDPSKWQQISAMNHGLQPDNVKAGQQIWLP